MAEDKILGPASNSLDAMLSRNDVKVDRSVEEALLSNPTVAEDENGLLPPQLATAPVFHKFRRGDFAYDEERLLKVIILEPEIGKSNKGEPIHKVVHKKSGESYIQFGKKLTHRLL